MFKSWRTADKRHNDPMISYACDDDIMPYHFEMCAFVGGVSRNPFVPMLEEEEGHCPKRARTDDLNLEYLDPETASAFDSYNLDVSNKPHYTSDTPHEPAREPESREKSRCDKEPDTRDQNSKNLDVVQAKPLHACNWSGCSDSAFTSRDGLNWHVKAEHLLICPALGCCESNFTSEAAVKTHLQLVHGGESADSQASKMEKDEKQTGSRQSQEGLIKSANNEAAGVNQKAKSPTETKQVCESRDEIEAAKTRCREQLDRIMKKRAARKQRLSNTVDANAGNPGSAAPEMSHVQLEVPSFPLLWEHCILPFLVEFLQTRCGPGHVISVCKGTKGQHPNSRRICLMTKDEISPTTKDAIKEHVKDLLPPLYKSHATFEFSRGKVERLMALARGLSQENPDDVCWPRNPFCYMEPCMGDSIGAADDEFIATLGPSLVVDGANFWLANFHPFLEAFSKHENVAIEHPSWADRELCRNEGHDAMVIPPGGSSFKLGTVRATSGFDLKTVRVSHDPYWEELDAEPPLVVTDWSLISSNRPRQANMLRRLPAAASVPVQRGSVTVAETVRNVPVVRSGSIIPGGTVITTGRTSGYQHGEICEIPAYLSSSDLANGTGYATREWFIQEPTSLDDEDVWIRGGVGVKGDSGAAVVDADSNELIGQLWGRNQYWGSGPRHTFFTPIADIFDDIHEKCRQQSRPRLPQFQGDWDREYVPFAVYPTCMRCFEGAAYLGTCSRRPSQASLCMNVDGGESSSLPALEGGTNGTTHGHARDDVTSAKSISEVITPSDTPATFASPRDTCLQGLQKTVGSPAALRVRSRYPPVIEDEALNNEL
ncbi:uncharacterized protein PpBr36_06528 [Pyricularia pennisetigena]|uniref:uncharacterized protein n=1 Tax=Pyricularia pennisetigena TaxID=1578925 RepID=UPI00114EA9C2|nr:uncharacterized protein PpBr36_06528 [Pyricularia pennisetigena]TLS23756.1 hypothetical protein PpBr36_06528 [Pyricularia pennisetigena]